MVTVPVAEWAPDQGQLAGGTTEALNVIPLTAAAYGPLKNLNPVALSLASPVLGGQTMEGTGGNVRLYAGTTDTLYEMEPSVSWEWFPLGTDYDATQDSVWRFAQFKSECLATNGVDPIQVATLGVGNFGVLSADAPIAQFICVTTSFVVVGYTTDPVGGIAGYRVWWSGLNDATSWPTPGSAAAQAAQSDYNDFAGGGGFVTGLVSNLGNAELGIFFQHSVYRGTYVGPPDIFDFTLAVGAKGCFGSRSIVTLGALVYYLGEDGFYTFDGAYCTPIGFGKIDRWFWSKVNPNLINQDAVIGSYDYITRTVRWIFPSSATGSSKVADMMLIYQPELQRWTHATISAEFVMTVLPVDGNPEPQIGVFTGHQLAFHTGPNAAAEMTTVEAEMTPGGRTFVQGVRPLVDGGQPTVAIATRYQMQNPQKIGADVGLNVAGESPQRAEGRYVQGILKVPSAGAWTKAEGMEVRAIASGTR